MRTVFTLFKKRYNKTAPFKLIHQRSHLAAVNLSSHNIDYLNNSSKQKQKSIDPERRFSYSSCCIPKATHIRNKNFGKIEKNFGYAGEDSYFSLKVDNKFNDSQSLFIGIADGVGNATGSANYAQQLMLSGIEYLTLTNDVYFNNDNMNDNLLYKIADYSSNVVTNNALNGASTLCLMNILPEEYDINYKCNLNGYNLGDSGFCIYRYFEKTECYSLICSSEKQSKTFGVPYQLGAHKNANSVRDGFCLNNFQLKSNDIIIAGSDGLWDNLWQNDIETLIHQIIQKYNNNNECIHNKITKHDLTNRLLKQALSNSINREISTPWSQSMTENIDMIYNGGKQDDITCIIVFIH